METTTKELTGIEILRQPITATEIEWRVQNQTKDGKKLVVVPYISNRCVMDRFDAAFGWDGWGNSIKEIAGGYLCQIAVSLGDGKTITKTDGASQTGIEAVKGGISDSMKRCAVQFGLGRGLYTYPKVMIETTDRFIPNWALPRLWKMTEQINGKLFKKELVILKQMQ